MTQPGLSGVDSLRFVSVDGLYRACGVAEGRGSAPRFCDACFSGDYSIRVEGAKPSGVSVPWDASRREWRSVQMETSLSVLRLPLAEGQNAP